MRGRGCCGEFRVCMTAGRRTHWWQRLGWLSTFPNHEFVMSLPLCCPGRHALQRLPAREVMLHLLLPSLSLFFPFSSSLTPLFVPLSSPASYDSSRLSFLFPFSLSIRLYFSLSFSPLSYPSLALLFPRLLLPSLSQLFALLNNNTKLYTE